MQLSLFQKCGPQASRAKTSRLREWARGRGFEGRDLDCFLNLLDSLENADQEFLSSKTFRACSVRTPEEILESCSGLWPNSGILSDGVLLTARTSESHSRARGSSLSAVIETGEVPEQYFLSRNAARGMLRRAERMGRNLKPHLRESLERLAAKVR